MLFNVQLTNSAYRQMFLSCPVVKVEKKRWGNYQCSCTVDDWLDGDGLGLKGEGRRMERSTLIYRDKQGLRKFNHYPIV